MFKTLFYNRVGSLFFEDVKMQGHFYFIEEQYFIDFPDKYLMKNKEVKTELSIIVRVSCLL